MTVKFRPGSQVAGRPRHSQRPLPRYSYVPGFSPHPISHPDGHSYGQEFEPAPQLHADWQRSEAFLYAVDLFNHGYYWEAHEVWESLWHAAGRRGSIADGLKGLIKLAAAAVKLREGNARGVRRHARRAEELLRNAAGDRDHFAGVALAPILQCLSELQKTQPLDSSDPKLLLPVVIALQSPNRSS